MTWSFSFSFWIVNGVYESNYNASAHQEPTIITVDDCGPPNLISPGYGLWLVLVPAVACVPQPPGSLVLFGRSNFYRFSPELGIAEALAAVLLLGKAVWAGYRWDESLAAVLVVREAIGRGDLWWRSERRLMEETVADHGQRRSIEMVQISNIAQTSPGAPNPRSAPISSPSDEIPPSDDNSFLVSKFAPILEPISTERVLGMALFIIAFAKVIAIITSSAKTDLFLASLLALAFSASHLLFEILTWSLHFPFRRRKVRDIPLENLLAVVMLVDPGDNPFTFPSAHRPENHQAPSEMESGAIPNGNAPSTPTESQIYPWNKAVAVITAFFSFIGPLLWMIILSHVWSPTRGVLILTIASFFAVRLLVELIYLRVRRLLTKSSNRINQNNDPSSTSQPAQMHISNREPSGPNAEYNTHGTAVFFIVWMWRRLTVVNLYSAIWIAVICCYFAIIFPMRATLLSGDEAPRKPLWLDWLG